MALKLLLSEGTPQNNGYQWIFVALLVVLVVVLLVVPMFTNKKRAKQTTEMHNSLKPGDVIKTVGGIIGTIKEVRQISPTEKEMVIETGDGDNKTTMVFDIQALYQIMSRAEAPAAEPTASTDVFDAEKPEETPDTTEATKPEPATEEQAGQPADVAPVTEKEETVAAAAEAVDQPEVAEPAEDVAAQKDEPAATADDEQTEGSKAKAAPKAKASQAPKSNSAKKKSTGKNSTKK